MQHAANTQMYGRAVTTKQQTVPKMDIERLVGLNVLNTILYFWVQFEDVGKFDTAVCNIITRNMFLKQVLLAVAPKQDQRGNLFYHKSFSQISLRFEKDISSHNNILCFWSNLKLNWIIRRSIQITWLELCNVDLGGNLPDRVLLLDLQHVSCFHVDERNPSNCDLDSSDLNQLLNRSRYSINLYVQKFSLPSKFTNLSNLINSCPKLITLTVKNSLGLSCDSLTMINKTILNQLLRLQLQIRCDSTSPIIPLVDILAKFCNNLIVLDINATEMDWLCLPINNEEVTAAFVRLIQKNPHLEFYKVYTTVNMFTLTMAALIDFCPQLRSVSCNVTREIMSLQMKTIASLLNNCHKLVQLEIRGRYLFDIIYNKWEGSLYLSGSPRLSCVDVIGFFEGIKHPLLSISRIDLYNLQSITEQLFECMVIKHPQLLHFTSVECGFSLPTDGLEDTVKRILGTLCGNSVEVNLHHAQLDVHKPLDKKRQKFSDQYIAENILCFYSDNVICNII